MAAELRVFRLPYSNAGQHGQTYVCAVVTNMVVACLRKILAYVASNTDVHPRTTS